MAVEAPASAPNGLVDASSPSAEPFRSLRLALELRTEHRSGNIVLFASAEPGEGKSTIAANFALISSFSHSSVLLIDGDLRRPTLHSLFRVPRAPGLVDGFTTLATGQATADTFPPVHEVGNIARLSLITAGNEFARTGDLVASKRMAQFLAAASKSYGLVVLDAPPLLLSADAAGYAAHPGVDVVLIVARNSRRRQTLNALRKLELVGANVIGLVANREGSLTTYGY
ncbi:MAG: CpsD/CapB family tyrosine-protein kinase [Gaiellaceae bacterium]